ncbi:hypothetical protein [Mesorhizobium sp. M1406]|uniref:hypothetical protein n=1 Tax=Mesorhizobium sp. M1406 TaxID=2957099 RepID=UPI00333B7860
MSSVKSLLFLMPMISWGVSMMIFNYRKHLLVKKYNAYGSFAHNDGAGMVRIDWESKEITPDFLREWAEVTLPYKVAVWSLSVILAVDIAAILAFGT